MNEAVRLPAFAAVPVLCENFFQPRVVVEAVRSRQLDVTVERIFVIGAPEHGEYALFCRTVCLQERVAEHGGRSYWRKLPPVSEADDVQTAPWTGGAVVSSSVSVAGPTHSSQVAFHDTHGEKGCTANLVYEQPPCGPRADEETVHVFVAAPSAGEFDRGFLVDRDVTPAV